MSGLVSTLGGSPARGPDQRRGYPGNERRQRDRGYKSEAYKSEKFGVQRHEPVCSAEHFRRGATSNFSRAAAHPAMLLWRKLT